MNQGTVLLEIYKLHVELADRIGQRRQTTNQFYLSLVTALFVIFSFLFNKDVSAYVSAYRGGIIISVVGILICFIWLGHIHAFKQLSAEKHSVLLKLEAQLPFAFYQLEWDQLTSKRKYLRQTRIEKWTPVLMLVIFVFIGVYCTGKVMRAF